MDVLQALYTVPVTHSLPTHSHMILLVKALLDDDLIRWEKTPEGVTIGGLKSNPDYLFITDKGRKFMDDFTANKGMSYEKVGEL